MKRLSLLFWLLLCATTRANVIIGTNSALPLLSSQVYMSQQGDTPDDGSVQTLNPPIFKWIYDGDKPRGFAEDMAPRTFTFQLSTNAGGTFSSFYWNISTLNNFYNLLPAITNADGSPFTGTNYWRIIYGNSNATTILSTGLVHTFTLSTSATNWDRSMLADSNYLYSVLSPHPHMAFWATNRDTVMKFWMTNTVNGWNWVSASNIAVQTVTNSWWTNNAVFTNQSQGAIVNDFYSIFYVAWFYQLTTNSYLASYHPEIMYDQFNNWYMTNSMDRSSAYVFDDTAMKEMPMVMDYLWPLMSSTQQSNAIYTLDETVKFFINEDWWFAGSTADPTRTYAYNARAAGEGGAMKLGNSHQRFDSGVGLAMCMGGWASSSNLQFYFPYFMNYMLGKNDPAEGDEGRVYNDENVTQTFHDYGSQAMAIYAFRAAKPELDPFYNTVANQYAYMEPVLYQSWTEPWGDLGFTPTVPLGDGPLAYSLQLYFWDLAYMTGSGEELQQYKRQNPTGFIESGGTPQFNGLTPYYFPNAPASTNWMSTDYIDPLRGYCVCGSYQPNDYAAFTNGVGFVTQARPGVNANHGMWSDGSIQLWAYGAQISAGGCEGYERHPMFHSAAVMVDGIGINIPRDDPVEDWYSRFIAFTNAPDFAYVASDTTKAYNRTNFATQDTPSNLIHPFYDQSTNKIPYLSSMVRHVIFPHRKYLVLYDTMTTTQAAHFQWVWHCMEPTDVINTNACSFNYTCTNFFNGSNVTVYVAPFVNPLLMTLTNLPGTNNYFVNPITGENYGPSWPDYDFFTTPAPLPNGSLWVYNTTATNSWHFGWVVYPAKWGQSAPTISRVTDNTVEVNDGVTDDVISVNETNASPASTMILLTAAAGGGGAITTPAPAPFR